MCVKRDGKAFGSEKTLHWNLNTDGEGKKSYVAYKIVEDLICYMNSKSSL